MYTSKRRAKLLPDNLGPSRQVQPGAGRARAGRRARSPDPMFAYSALVPPILQTVSSIPSSFPISVVVLRIVRRTQSTTQSIGPVISQIPHNKANARSVHVRVEYHRTWQGNVYNKRCPLTMKTSNSCPWISTPVTGEPSEYTCMLRTCRLFR